MQKHTKAILNRLLEECILMRSSCVTVALTEQEAKIIDEMVGELIAEGYVCGFCPKMDSVLQCDLTGKALDQCDFSNQTVL